MLRKKMFLSTIFVGILLSFVFSVSVQASSAIWVQTYGGPGFDWGNAVVATSDEGFAVAGITDAFDDEKHNFLLVKTDDFGNMEWNRTFDGEAPYYVSSLLETSDGGFLLVGSGLFNNQLPGILIKTDASGGLEWRETYDYACNSVVKTSDGGYVLAGATNPLELTSTGAHSVTDEPNDFWLAKIDSTGTIQWNTTYGDPEEVDIAYELIKTGDDGYALAGYSGGYRYEDIWLVKTDSSGNMLWNKTYETTRSALPFIPAFSLVETADGGYVLASPKENRSDPNPIDFYLVKTNAVGTMEWNQTYGGPDRDWPNEVITLPDGGFAIAGNTESSGAGSWDFWLIKTDEFGNLEWKQTYGGTEPDYLYSMVRTSDGGYAGTGRTYSFGDVNGDFWLVKTPGCREIFELQTYEFDFSYGYGEYVVVISTNSTVGGFDFGVDKNQISFTVTGPTGTTGVAKIIIPEDLTDEDFPVYLGEEMLVEGVDYTRTYNGTHTIIDMTYSHSTHMIVVTGTTVVPEYTSWFIPTLLLATVLLVVITRKKLSK